MAVWLKTVRVGDFFHDEEMSLEKKTKLIVARFYQVVPENDDADLDALLDELIDAGRAEDGRWVDETWHYVYDWADDNRVWIETVS